MSKKTSDSYTMGIRLDETESELLDKYALMLKKKKSQILKEAFRFWIMTRDNVENREFIFFPKPVIKRFFENTNEATIKEYAKEHSERFLGEFKILMLDKKGEITVEDLVVNLNQVFNIGLLNWFRVFEAKLDKEKKSMQIYGLHSMDLNFSNFLKEFIVNILDKGFNFHLNSCDESIMENAIHLTFIKK